MTSAPTPPPLSLLADIPTPALVVDLAAARRNHRRALDLLGPRQMLRTHFKAHKCTDLARLQVTDDAPAICCQTTWEALTLARAGFDDIMVTNQVVDPAALQELAESARLAEVSVLVDCPEHISLLESTARRERVNLGVLIEIDIGMKRCGVDPESDALLDLARAVWSAGRLRLLGLQAYAGHLAGLPDPAERREKSKGSRQATRAAVERLRSAGFDISCVAGGSTGHLPFIRDFDVWTEIQAGSYLLMDGAYRSLPDLDFEQALFALATVIHRSADRAVLDIGLKHLAVDRGVPEWIGSATAPMRLSDEHGAIAVPASMPLAVGDRTWIVPRHVDPTVNLHPALWLVDDDTVGAAPVDGRMPARQAPSS